MTETPAYADDDIETLQEKFKSICYTLNKELAKTAKRTIELYKEYICVAMCKLEENHDMTFDDHELVEEAMDTFIYKFQKTKEMLKDARLIQYHIAQKENEIRFAKNTLAQIGIIPK